MDFIRELISLISVFSSYVESPGNGPEKKEKVKQMIKDALPDEQWKIDPEFFDFILDVLIDLVVIVPEQRALEDGDEGIGEVAK